MPLHVPVLTGTMIPSLSGRRNYTYMRQHRKNSPQALPVFFSVAVAVTGAVCRGRDRGRGGDRVRIVHVMQIRSSPITKNMRDKLPNFVIFLDTSLFGVKLWR